MKKEREDLNSSPSLLEPDGAVAHATGGAECRQSSRSCSDEYAEDYLPNAILLHFLPPFCFYGVTIGFCCRQVSIGTRVRTRLMLGASPIFSISIEK